MIAEAAIKNEWEGVLINGCIRDVCAINDMHIGVKALGANPAKSIKRTAGILQEPVSFAHVTFKPGYFLYSDEDGILVSQKPLF
jgi:regulator of ribonuclease activity A